MWLSCEKATDRLLLNSNTVNLEHDKFQQTQDLGHHKSPFPINIMPQKKNETSLLMFILFS